MQFRHLAGLLALSAVWGASFLFIKIGVAEIPVESLVAMRVLLAVVVLLGVLLARGLRLPMSWRVWRDFLFTGVVGLVLPFLLITWGEQSISSGMAAILNGTTPLFTLILAYALRMQDRLSGVKLLGVMLGFVGVVVAVGVQDVDPASSSTQGQIAVLGAALCYGINGLYAQRAFRGMPSLVPATGQMVTAALVIVPIALVAHGLPAALPSAAALGAVGALGVFGTAMAYILFYWLLEQLGATRASMTTYLLPPIALLYGALLLHEQIMYNSIFGLALVVVGILLANGIFTRSQRKPGAPNLAT